MDEKNTPEGWRAQASDLRNGTVAQQEKASPDSMSSNPRTTWWKERPDCNKMSSDLHTHHGTCAPTFIHTHKRQRKCDLELKEKGLSYFISIANKEQCKKNGKSLGF